VREVDGKNCYVCGKDNLSRNEIGLSKKFFGRNIKKFYCISCLADHLEMTEEELMDRIEYFKDQGCRLFE
jgi:predicted nucleic-acid-binding Zn-ribbon protein